LNPGSFRIDCIDGDSKLASSTGEQEQNRRNHIEEAHLLHLIITGQLSSVYDGVTCNVGTDASPQSSKPFLKMMVQTDVKQAIEENAQYIAGGTRSERS
jgi:hypothetical protein